MDKINASDKIMFENQKKDNMKIKRGFDINLDLRFCLDINSQLAKAS